MDFHANIALHYLKPKNNSFISLLSFISISGIAIGVMVLILAISEMSGFGHVFKKKIIGIESQIIVLNHKGRINHYKSVTKDISGIKGVKSTSPFIYTDAMISSDNTSAGSILRGIDAKTEEKVTNLKRYLIKGNLSGLNNKKVKSIVLGYILAQHLEVSVGDKVLVMSPEGQTTAFGVMPKIEWFTVCGIINSGMYNYDSTFSFISIKNAQMFLGLASKTVTGIEVRLNKLSSANPYAKKIEMILNKKPSSSFCPPCMILIDYHTP